MSDIFIFSAYVRTGTARAANQFFDEDSGIQWGKSAIDFRAISLVGMLQD